MEDKYKEKIIIKNKIILIAIVLLIICVILILIALYILKAELSEPLYSDAYMNCAWEYADYGYIIYKNGIIKQYDNSTTKKIKEIRKANITEEELNRLLELADTVIDNFEKDDSFELCDAGTHTKKIYNNKLGEWIILSESRRL